MADETSTTSTETTDATAGPATGTAPEPAAQPDDKLGEAGTKALAEERRRASTAERDAKTAARERDTLKAELDKLRTASMSEQEKAVAAAKEEGRTAAAEEARKTFGSRLVDAELKAALAGRAVDEKQRTALLSRLDRTQFLTADGEVDAKAVTEWANDVAPTRAPSYDGGARGGPAKGADMNTLIRRAAGRVQL